MLSVIRAFVAIDLTPDIRLRMDQVIAQLKGRLEGVPVRWIPVENIHLTLKFLGDVSTANLEILQKILQAESANHPPFEFSVGGLGAFPGTRQPRVVWVGVEAPADLPNLQRGIETVLARLGYAREERPFTAHLTLCRVSRNTTARDAHAIGSAIEATKVGFLGVARVEAIHLYRSDLRPGGAVYSQVFSLPLKSTEP